MSEIECSFEKLSSIGNDIYELYIIPQAGFEFTAGQYITLILPQLEHLPARESFRDFSLSSSQSNTKTLRIIFRSSDSIYKQTLQRLIPGDTLRIEGPAGTFLLGNEKRITWIAGGVGITPFLSMLRSNLTSGRNINLLYSSAKGSNIIAKQEWDASSVSVTYAHRRIEPTLIRTISEDTESVMIAGPPSMVEQTRNILLGSGYNPKIIKTEDFPGYETI